MSFRSIGELTADIEARIVEKRAAEKQQLLDKFRDGKATRNETVDAIYRESLRHS